MPFSPDPTFPPLPPSAAPLHPPLLIPLSRMRDAWCIFSLGPPLLFEPRDASTTVVDACGDGDGSRGVFFVFAALQLPIILSAMVVVVAWLAGEWHPRFQDNV